MTNNRSTRIKTPLGNIGEKKKKCSCKSDSVSYQNIAPYPGITKSI